MRVRQTEKRERMRDGQRKRDKENKSETEKSETVRGRDTE